MASFFSGFCLVAILWFAVSWIFALRLKVRQGESMPKGNFIIAMLWMIAATFFIAVPQVSNFHVIWVLPLCAAVGAVAGLGAIGASPLTRTLHAFLWPLARLYANNVVLAGSGIKFESDES